MEFRGWRREKKKKKRRRKKGKRTNEDNLLKRFAQITGGRFVLGGSHVFPTIDVAVHPESTRRGDG